MGRLLWVMVVFIGAMMSAFLCADGCRSLDVSVGWRSDQLNWKTNAQGHRCAPGRARSHLLFKDIDSYAVGGTARWAGAAYYVRLAAEYGWTEKGRAREHFRLRSPLLYCPVEVQTSDPVKRHSEVYDFNGAVGYPFRFCHSRLWVAPLIGFSFHRQHLRVKGERHESSGSSSFCLSYCNPFVSAYSSNPFADSSDPTIASKLGFCTDHRTSSYRFTWYGFYLGADVVYLIDEVWTLFAELEGHCFDQCHRKRHSCTGVDFVDQDHKKGWAYGCNGVFGTTYYMINGWYTILSVDAKWWKSNAKHDDLTWKNVGVKVGVGYLF